MTAPTYVYIDSVSAKKGERDRPCTCEGRRREEEGRRERWREDPHTQQEPGCATALHGNPGGRISVHGPCYG